jgi:hypothetical protein
MKIMMLFVGGPTVLTCPYRLRDLGGYNDAGSIESSEKLINQFSLGTIRFPRKDIG